MRRIDRTGEVRMMNNGLLATIIKYRNALDMDIEFRNGEIVRGIRYRTFKDGKIKCPMIVEDIDDYIKVTNPNISFEFLCDTDDLEIMNNGYWSMDAYGYAYNKKIGKFHRAIMGNPIGAEIDHINHNKKDNRKNNLRICTHAENLRNVTKHLNNSSGYKGVSWNKQRNKWHARIEVNGNDKHPGYYDDKLEAAEAYNEAAIRYHDEYACLNELYERTV